MPVWLGKWYLFLIYHGAGTIYAVGKVRSSEEMMKNQSKTKIFFRSRYSSVLATWTAPKLPSTYCVLVGSLQCLFRQSACFWDARASGSKRRWTNGLPSASVIFLYISTRHIIESFKGKNEYNQDKPHLRRVAPDPRRSPFIQLELLYKSSVWELSTYDSERSDIFEVSQ